MNQFANETFDRYWERPGWFSGAPYVHEHIRFESCEFVECAISRERKPHLRTIVRNVEIISCTQRHCDLGHAIVENTLVEDLTCGSPLFGNGTVFKHVTLKGKIGPFAISPAFKLDAKSRPAFELANQKYYQNVDWALDIRDALFTDPWLRNVPARLIRRDSKTQMVITRETAIEGKWKNVDLSKTYWPLTIEQMIRDGTPDLLLLAPKQASNFDSELEGLHRLRAAGIVE